ncbi:uncharacterized protein AAEQ78_006160 isoform 1-T2 [Lycaon pictus]
MCRSLARLAIDTEKKTILSQEVWRDDGGTCGRRIAQNGKPAHNTRRCGSLARFAIDTEKKTFLSPEVWRENCGNVEKEWPREVNLHTDHQEVQRPSQACLRHGEEDLPF